MIHLVGSLPSRFTYRFVALHTPQQISLERSQTLTPYTVQQFQKVVRLTLCLILELFEENRVSTGVSYGRYGTRTSVW